MLKSLKIYAFYYRYIPKRVSFVVNLLPMKLVMYFGADCVDAVSLNTKCISQPGYLGSLKRRLIEKYASELQNLSQEPEFLIARIDGGELSSAAFTKKKSVLQAVAE